MLLLGIEIDKRLSWPLGRSERLAKRRKLPHVVLPDGSVRFDWHVVEATLRQVPAATSTEHGAAPCN